MNFLKTGMTRFLCRPSLDALWGCMIAFMDSSRFSNDTLIMCFSQSSHTHVLLLLAGIVVVVTVFNALYVGHPVITSFVHARTSWTFVLTYINKVFCNITESGQDMHAYRSWYDDKISAKITATMRGGRRGGIFGPLRCCCMT